MNILDFINSRDIREYLEKTGYFFTSIQSAYIIDHSNRPLADCLRAFSELIEKSGDCEIPRRRNCDYYVSLHGYLRGYIDYLNALVEKLREESSDYIYQLSYQEGKNHFDDVHVFRRFEDCLRYAKELFEVEDGEESKLSNVTVMRKWVSTGSKDQYASINAIYNKDFEMVDIFYSGTDEQSEIRANWENNNPFNGMWFDIPVPFKKGDIVINVNDKFHSEPMVFDRIITERSEYQTDESYMRLMKRLAENGDDTDMNYYAVSAGEWSEDALWHEAYFSFLDLEYYRGELTGSKRILKAVSSYYKSEISVELLIKAVLQIRMEEQADSFRKYIDCFTKEGQRLAGLSGGDKDNE